MIERVINNLLKRREKVLRGGVNCIPSPFNRFSNDYIGIEQGKYYLISAQTKGAKTQLASFLFLFNPLLYSYYNHNVDVKIFYIALEETPENIILRFMSYLLFLFDNIRKSPMELLSTKQSSPISSNVLDLLNTEKYQRILKFFEEHVTFLEERNPTGIYKKLVSYASENGVAHKKRIEIIDKVTGNKKEVDTFDYYEPHNPNEYVIIITDHVSLLDTESGFDLRQTINKFSEYMILLRNRYNYTPVVIQQQSTETTNLDAYKSKKIIPTMAGLADSKYTAKDCNIFLGIANPYAFEYPEFQNYDITKLRGNVRFLSVVLNRNGPSGGIIALFFDGAICFFKELPKVNDSQSLEMVYRYINRINKAEEIVEEKSNDKEKNTNFAFLAIKKIFNKIKGNK